MSGKGNDTDNQNGSPSQISAGPQPLASSQDAQFAQALALHQRGEPAEARALCGQIVKMAPEHFGAQYLLGLLLLKEGRLEEGERQIGLALSINPGMASAHRNRGMALAQLGRREEALVCLNAAIALKPEAAVLHIRGNLLRDVGRSDAAIESYTLAIAQRPDFLEAFRNRSAAFFDLGQHEKALADLDRALTLNPGQADVMNMRGKPLHLLGRFADAAESFASAIALKPDYAEAYRNRALSLYELDRIEEALESLDKAIALNPQDPICFHNLGKALQAMKRPQEAFAAYDKAIALNPDFAEAMFFRGLCKLSLHLSPNGWNDFEYRGHVIQYASPPPQVAPEWRGENLRGKSILITCEPSFGDIFQFARFLPRLSSQGAQVHFLVPEKLCNVLRGLPGGIRLLSSIGEGDRFDFECALMSLPHRFAVTLENLPASVPYLFADPERRRFWSNRIGPDGFRIGICWQGGLWQGGAGFAGRSFPVGALYPVSRIEGVRLLSLQKNLGVEQLKNLPAGLRVETLGKDFDEGPNAFADTAAVMDHLDLTISCDTSIAHLAGALGRTTWLALRYAADWRWMLDRSDSPWYPTMRLFRQPARNDWASVFRAMAAELSNMRLVGQARY